MFHWRSLPFFRAHVHYVYAPILAKWKWKKPRRKCGRPSNIICIPGTTTTTDTKIDCHKGVYDSGAFKLDHMQSTKPMFAKWISTSLIGHMQHSLIQHAGERVLHNGSQKWMRAMGVWPWDIQIGQYEVHKTYFCKMNFCLLNRAYAAFLFTACRGKGTP